jgi:glycosyltransferase involved in cell wall biosynthesis
MHTEHTGESSRRLISVVVPAMNEEESLHLFYQAVRGVTDRLAEFDWEFIFVDDGSTDRTLPVLLDLRERDPRVSVIQLSRNFGSHAALRAGIDYAWGDAVITISADLQDSPELFTQFVERWQEGYHTVWGVRASRDDPWNHRVLAGLFYRVLRGIALPGVPPGGMDCGLFDRKVIDALRRIPDGNSITFMTIFWMGFRQAQVPYHRQPRRFGYSKWPLGKRIKAALDVITAYSFAPVRLASYGGVALAGLAVVTEAAALGCAATLGTGLGWPSLVSLLLFLAGFQLLTLGLLGEYVWRIGTEVRGRPYYIAMNEFSSELRARRSPRDVVPLGPAAPG